MGCGAQLDHRTKHICSSEHWLNVCLDAKCCGRELWAEVHIWSRAEGDDHTGREEWSFTPGVKPLILPRPGDWVEQFRTAISSIGHLLWLEVLVVAHTFLLSSSLSTHVASASHMPAGRRDWQIKISPLWGASKHSYASRPLRSIHSVS